MPSPVLLPFQVTPTGLAPLPPGPPTFEERLREAGPGSYSVLRIYPGWRTLRLEEHVARLNRSAAALGSAQSLEAGAVRSWLRQALSQAGFPEARACLFLPLAGPGRPQLWLQAFTPLAESEVLAGVRVGLAHYQRPDPATKDARFALLRPALREQDPGAHETLMHDGGGRILEGLSSNFFALLGGQLRTAGEGILPGITRAVLLEAAWGLLEVRFEPVRVAEIPRVQEAFITSASRGVLPVVRVGEVRIGTGVPGPVTLELRERYQARVEAELEPVG